MLHGRLDRMVHVANARLLAERIPRARLAVVDGVGHLPLLEQPLPVRALILDWMAEQGPLPPGRPLPPALAAAEPWTRMFGLQVGAARAWAATGTRVCQPRSTVRHGADAASAPDARRLVGGVEQGRSRAFTINSRPDRR